jgi:hypothetical protein
LWIRGAATDFSSCSTWCERKAAPRARDIASLFCGAAWGGRGIEVGVREGDDVGSNEGLTVASGMMEFELSGVVGE